MSEGKNEAGWWVGPTIALLFFSALWANPEGTGGAIRSFFDAAAVAADTILGNTTTDTPQPPTPVGTS